MLIFQHLLSYILKINLDNASLVKLDRQNDARMLKEIERFVQAKNAMRK
jgi:hypothetical protein